MKHLLSRVAPTALLLGLVVSPASAIGIAEIYALAEANNAGFAGKQAEFAAAQENLPLAKSALRPKLNTSFGLNRQYSKSRPDGEASSDATWNGKQLALALQHKLYDRSSKTAIKQAELGVDIAAHQFSAAEEDLIIDTATSYFAVLTAQDSKTLAERELTAIGRQLDLAQQRLDVGLGTKTDLYDANARFQLTNANLIAADNEISNSKRALEALIGMPLTVALAQLSDQKIELSNDQGIDSWITAALETNSGLAVQELQTEVAKLELDKAEQARHPTLSLEGSASRADSDTSLSRPAGDSDAWNIGLQLALPIYQGGAIAATQRQAGYQYAQASSTLEQTRRTISTSVGSAYSGIKSLQLQVDALAEAVKASESALEAKEEGFKAGVSTNLDVLDSQRDLFSAQRNFLKARYDTVIALLQLEKVTGTLNTEDIVRINGWLQ